MIHILSAGACKGLFQALFAKRLESGKAQASFGAVGAMKEKLIEGVACDVLVLTQAMLEQLANERWVDASTIRPIGAVGTGIAIPKKMQSCPDVSTSDTLKANLLAATSIHFPDPARATAGIHFKQVLDNLGIYDVVAARCHLYPNGAATMASLASRNPTHGDLPIGCAQVSEILYSKGVRLVAELPAPFVRRTLYSAALTPAGIEDPRARKMIDKLSGDKSRALRIKGGFQP